MENLRGKKVAILVEDGFEQVELTEPKQALDDAGATTHIISPTSHIVKGWDEKQWGDEFHVDATLAAVKASDYDALLLPGGVMNSDKLRQSEEAVRFVKDFFDAAKPVAAICHGGQILIDADLVAGRHMTSYSSLQNDFKNAGANWVDEEVVCDQGFVTSRKPADIPAFNAKMIEEIAEGRHVHI